MNPFREIIMWIKGEMQDMLSMQEALDGRERLIKEKQATESKMRSRQSEVDVMSAGKKTLK